MWSALQTRRNWKQGSGPTELIHIRHAGIEEDTIRHFPAPVLLPIHVHTGPAIDPHVVFPDLPVINEASDYGIAAFMAAPHPVARICTLATVEMEVPAHWRASAFPICI